MFRGHRKFTADQVREIRRQYSTTPGTALAKAYGCCDSLIAQIASRQIYRDVEDDACGVIIPPTPAVPSVTTIKPGDVVQLASGGPRMTVAYAEERGEVYCAWFTTAGTPRYQRFAVSGLVRVTADAPDQRGRRRHEHSGPLLRRVPPDDRDPDAGPRERGHEGLPVPMRRLGAPSSATYRPRTRDERRVGAGRARGLGRRR